jgi:hypothetical protein
VLLQGRDPQDPLFLQVKEAAASVLEDHFPKSRYRPRGERVVRGQQMMQAASDIFLGWFTGPDGRHYYWRPLRDMKGSATVEAMSPRSLSGYANLCAWTLGDDTGSRAVLALPDGVFAVVITLLVLEIHVPELTQGHSLAEALAEVRPSFNALVVTFILTGMYRGSPRPVRADPPDRCCRNVGGLRGSAQRLRECL